jgi:hypothetical protein
LGCTIIDHRRLNITWPQQLPNVAFRKNLYGFIEDLQNDFDLWIQSRQRGQAYLGTVLLIVGGFIIPLSQPPHKPLRWLYRQCVHMALEPDLVTRGSGVQHFASCCRFSSAITPITARID